MTRHMELRAELWARVYAGIAASTGGSQQAARVWADQALKEFDDRFKADPSKDDEERAIIEMLSLSGEVGGRKPGEERGEYARRVLREICRLKAEGVRQ